MGIQGLLGVLKEIQTPTHVKEYKGKKFAVDAYVWLHRGAYGCAQELATGSKTLKYVNYAMHRVRMLKHYGVTPLIVFDGGYLPSKAGTEIERERRRADALAKGNAFLAEGKLTQARDAFVKAVDVTPAMAYQLIKALRREGVEYIVAPYEADPQLAYLEKEGIVDGVITEDSDLLIFGCRTVLFKLDGEGHCVAIDRSQFSKCREYNFSGWSDTEFRHMAILSGCDYLDSVVGLGLKTAYKLLKKYKTPEKVIQFVRLEGNLTVPRDYIDLFKRADMTFLHQRVFCPRAQALVHFTPLPPHISDAALELPFVGAPLDDELARRVAEGEVDPITKEPIEDLNPGDIASVLDLKLTNSNSTSSFYKGSAGKSTTKHSAVATGKGSILSFFKKESPTTPIASSSKVLNRSSLETGFGSTTSTSKAKSSIGNKVSKFFGAGSSKPSKKGKESQIESNNSKEQDDDLTILDDVVRVAESDDEEAEAVMRDQELQELDGCDISARSTPDLPPLPELPDLKEEIDEEDADVVLPPSTLDALSSPDRTPSPSPDEGQDEVVVADRLIMPATSDAGVSSPPAFEEEEDDRTMSSGEVTARRLVPSSPQARRGNCEDDDAGGLSSPEPTPVKMMSTSIVRIKPDSSTRGQTIDRCQPPQLMKTFDLSSDPIGPSSDDACPDVLDERPRPVRAKTFTTISRKGSNFKIYEDDVRSNSTAPAPVRSKKRPSQEALVKEEDDDEEESERGQSASASIASIWRQKYMLPVANNGNKMLRISPPSQKTATTLISTSKTISTRATLLSQNKTITVKRNSTSRKEISSLSTLDSITTPTTRIPLSPRKTNVVQPQQSLGKPANSSSPTVPCLLKSTSASSVPASDDSIARSSPVLITNSALLKYRFRG